MNSKPSRLNWDHFQFFLALTDQKTLSGAARCLNVTHATMARRIAPLEKEMGTVLFDQSASGYRLTEKGEGIYKLVLDMREQIAAIQALAENEEPEGLVRVAATSFLADELVTHCFPNFRRRFPHIDLEINAGNRTVSLARMEAHISLRLRRPEAGQYIIRKVATMNCALYRSQRLEIDESVAPIVQLSEELDHVPEQRWLAAHMGERRPALRTNSVSLQMAAIEQGVGIGLLPLCIAARSDRLIPIAVKHDLPSREVWLTMRRPLGDVLRVRILADYLVEFFKSRREQFETGTLR